MMGRRERLIDGDEVDALTRGGRHAHKFRSGQRSAVKRKVNKTVAYTARIQGHLRNVDQTAQASYIETQIKNIAVIFRCVGSTSRPRACCLLHKIAPASKVFHGTARIGDNSCAIC